MICERCGGPLFVDRESIVQLVRAGFDGARIYCRAGCTDVWLKRRRAVAERAEPKPEPRGSYARLYRTFQCETCGRPGQTRGYRTRWCEDCKTARRRQHERASYARRRRRRRVSAA